MGTLPRVKHVRTIKEPMGRMCLDYAHFRLGSSTFCSLSPLTTVDEGGSCLIWNLTELLGDGFMVSGWKALGNGISAS